VVAALRFGGEGGTPQSSTEVVRWKMTVQAREEGVARREARERRWTG
jgi:hypothetical protein